MALAARIGPDEWLSAVVARLKVIGLAVTFERAAVLEATLRAFSGQTRPVDSLIVVDNSAGGDARDVVRQAGGIHLAMGENLGPGGGYQRGLDHVLSSDVPDDSWILFIDDDDPPRHDAELSDLVDFAARVGAHGPVGGVGRAGGRINGIGRLRRVPDSDLRGAVPVDYIGSGQLPLYNVGAMRRIRLNLTSLFFGYEDLDIGLALRSSGQPLYVDGDAWLKERERLGVRNVSPRGARMGWVPPTWRRYYSARNLVDIARRRLGLRAAVSVSCIETAAGLRASFVQRDTAQCGATLRGIVDAWGGRFGRTMEPGRKAVAS